jgi:hypothetical protein
MSISDKREKEIKQLKEQNIALKIDIDNALQHKRDTTMKVLVLEKASLQEK